MSDKGDLNNYRVQALLQEVQFLRQEILNNISTKHRIEASALGLFAALGAFAWSQKELGLLLLGPIISWASTFLWLEVQSILDAIGGYLHDEIEEIKWPELIGNRNAGEHDPPSRSYWVGWQHHYDDSIPSLRESWQIPIGVCVIGVLMLFIGTGAIDRSINVLGFAFIIVIDFLLLAWCSWELRLRIFNGTLARHYKTAAKRQTRFS